MSAISADDIGSILLSLKVAAVAAAVELPAALAVAYALSRARFAARVVLEAFVTLPLVLPPVATGFALLLLLGRDGPIGAVLAHVGVVVAFRWTGAVIAAAVMAFPLMVRPMRLAMEAIEPEVEEAALTLGASAPRRFILVTLPLAAPGVLAGAVLGFARALGEFGATITFVGAIPGETLTLPTAIYEATQSPGQEGEAIALGLVSAALAIAALFVSEIILARMAARARR